MKKKTEEEWKKNFDFFNRHRNFNEWWSQFDVDKQLLLCETNISLGAISTMEEDICPTLGLIKTCYHEDAVKWMMAQIDVLNVYISAQSKLNGQQIELLARDMISQYYYWNMADVCVFLGKIRRGQYGVFYNNVDNMSIMYWARQYNKERSLEIENYEKALAEQKKAEQKASTPTQSADEYFASLTEEQKAQSSLYAIETGKRKLFECAPKVEHTVKTGITKPADLDCPPPLSAETIARRDAMIAQLMKENPDAFKDAK